MAQPSARRPVARTSVAPTPLSVSEAAKVLGMSEARVRQLRLRTGALVESGGIEAMLDRVLAKRLRPLVAETSAARASYEEQVQRRVLAEARATRAEEAAEALRLRVAQLESQVSTLSQRPTGLFRRRKVTPAEQA